MPWLSLFHVSSVVCVVASPFSFPFLSSYAFPHCWMGFCAWSGSGGAPRPLTRSLVFTPQTDRMYLRIPIA
ncbi:hypothetical protein BC567DRAFT_223537 [Phyllosticta citribraziliensis]